MHAYRLAYDGAGYRGFQRQPHGDTVSDALLDALVALDVTTPAERVPDGYAAAGRTDAGVSATHQTVGFAAPDWLAPTALNAELPADVRAWARADAPADFHATRDAVRRTYEYHRHAPDADDGRARAACDRLAGRNDLRNLTPDDDGTDRELSVSVAREAAFLVLTVAAEGFPRQLVRRLASLVAAVARGDRDLAFVDRVLAPEPLDGPDGVAPAAPEPLVLVDVAYPDLSFDVDDDAARDARRTFEARRVARATGARVAARLRDHA